MLKVPYFLGLFLLLFSCAKDNSRVDILITNGTVYDGVSEVPSMLDIAIKNGKITAVGKLDSMELKPKRVIDAFSKVVSPGFIDPHTHADRDLINPETAHNMPFLMQGVTTVVVGSDGDSFLPLKKHAQLYDSIGIGTNVVQLVGHGSVRKHVMGKSDRKPTPSELKEMRALVQEEMDQGAFGMSTGLFYAPGSYSNTNEVIELAKTVAMNDGIYDTHLRDESSFTVGLVSAVQEALEIGEKAQIPIHISHIKCLGKDVWGKSQEVIDLIEKAKAKGVHVTANQYPYEASATSLKAAVVPRWAESGGLDSLFIRLGNPDLEKRILDETNRNMERRGGPSKLLIVKLPDTTYVGKNLKEIAQLLHVTPEQAVFELLQIGHAKVVSFNMALEDIHNFMQQDWVVTGSDGNTGHPRKYGSFPRKYAKYVKQDSIISLAKFINGSTHKTAEIFKIPQRGAIKEGYCADIIIFDPDKFEDRAGYTDAFLYAKGLEYSIINGRMSVEKGQYTDQLNGSVLLKQQALK